MIKKFVIIVSGILVLLIGIIIAGLYFLGSIITPEFLIKQIESNINVRAEISRVNINLLSLLSSVQLEGIKLTHRDEVSDNGTPLLDRNPIQSPVVSIESANLGLGLGSILRKELNLDKLILVSPSIQIVVFESGGNNLTSLFKPPVIVDGNPNPKLSIEAMELRKRELEEAARKKEENPELNQPFNIQTIPVSLAMRELGIKNGNFILSMNKTNQVIHLRGTNLLFKNLNVVPSDLTNHNSVDLSFDTQMVVIGTNGQESALIQLSSEGRIQPFEANTGFVNPNLSYMVKLHKDSYINGFTVFDTISNRLPVLRTFQINTDRISEKAELNQDVTMNLGYTKGRVTFKDSPLLPTTNYDLKIMEGTWIQITNNTHLMEGKILSSKEESDRAMVGIDRTLETNAKGMDTSSIKEEITSKLFENGRLSLPFHSTGDLRSPNVSLGVELPSLTGVIKGAATQAAKDEIKKKIPKEATNALKKFGF